MRRCHFLSPPFPLQSTPSWPHHHNPIKWARTKGTRGSSVPRSTDYILIPTSPGLLEASAIFLKKLSVQAFMTECFPGFPMVSQSLPSRCAIFSTQLYVAELFRVWSLHISSLRSLSPSTPRCQTQCKYRVTAILFAIIPQHLLSIIFA